MTGPAVRPRWAGAVALSMAVAGASCRGQASGLAASGERVRVTVLAAASLSRVFPAIGERFTGSHPGVTVSFSFGGTDSLAAQIEQGAPADVFAGAAEAFGDELVRRGLVESVRPFCTNRLALVVPSANPARLDSARELAAPGVKLVVGADTVPVGAYTRTVLSNLDSVYGPGYSAKVLANVVSDENDVEGVLAKVESGEADAGFVYLTDAAAAAPSVRTIDLPAQAGAVATYPIGVVKASAHPGQARQFVSFVLGPAAQAVLRAAGFGAPPPS